MRDFRKRVEIQAKTTVLATATELGSAIDTRNFDFMVVTFEYTNGDETSYDIIPYMLDVVGGDEHQLCTWSGAANMALTQHKYRLTATAKAYFVLDVRGVAQVKLVGDATGGTPSGTVQIGYSLIKEGA